MKSFLFIAFLLVSIPCINALQGDTTVSGLSSGGFMATQMHVAYSATIKGAAIFAGGPYYCAQGSMITATTTCMSTGIVSIEPLYAKIKSYSTAKSIDDYSNLSGSKVFILDGTNDHTVNPKVGQANEDLYKKLGAAVVSNYKIQEGHGMPTLNTGVTCSATQSPYINKCNYNGAYEALKYLYGDSIVVGTTYDKSRIKKIAQKAPTGSSMGPSAYAYVPAACESADCAIHVVFHGCAQTVDDISMQYVETTGYNEVAEANGIIMLYPQAKKNMLLPSNPNGCWDWWGYTNGNYAVKSGNQMAESMRLIQGVKSKSLEMEDVYETVHDVLKVSA